jgi:hypothetical protein
MAAMDGYQALISKKFRDVLDCCKNYYLGYALDSTTPYM